MRKRLLAVTLSVMMTASMLAGCGGKADTKDTKKVQTEQDSSKEEGTAEESSEKKNAAEDAGLEDGVYTAEFHTDSSMFHANETKDGKGTLTVKDGKMVFHVTLHSKNCQSVPWQGRGCPEGWSRASAADRRYGDLFRWSYGRGLWI